MTIKQLLFAIVLSIVAVFGSHADEPEVIAPIFINLIEENGEGVYQQVLREAGRRAGLSYNERVYPLKRALSNFSSKRGLCIYGLVDPVIRRMGRENIVSSFPLGVAKLYVFTRQGEPPVTALEQLAGKRVAGTLGYEFYYQAFIDRGISISYEGNEKSNIRMLEAGRIDALLGFLPDYNRDLHRLSYSENDPVVVVYDSLSCQNSAAGRQFADRISVALRQMKADGTLRLLMGEHYLDFDDPPAFK